MLSLFNALKLACPQRAPQCPRGNLPRDHALPHVLHEPYRPSSESPSSTPRSDTTKMEWSADVGESQPEDPLEDTRIADIKHLTSQLQCPPTQDAADLAHARVFAADPATHFTAQGRKPARTRGALVEGFSPDLGRRALVQPPMVQQILDHSPFTIAMLNVTFVDLMT